MNINPNQTVGELAATIPAAIPAFERWGIDYCCQGRTSLADACASSGITLEAAIEVLSAPSTTAAEQDWTIAPLTELDAYIVDRFHVYTRQELETIVAIADKVAGVHGKNHPETEEIRTIFFELRQELIPHMMKEEQILFPYIQELETALKQGKPAPQAFFGTVRNPIQMMLMEHDTAGEKLAEMRRLSNGYNPPEDACFSYRTLYSRLAEFERMTHEHIHLENNIVFPRAIEMEERGGAAFETPGCHGPFLQAQRS